MLLFFAAAHAATPVGYLDAADGTHIAGWASDGDYAGAIAVHIYVDGVLVKGLAADSYRSDVGSHAFDWAHEPFGDGPHEVVVYAIGVDSSGAPDGENPALTGSPASFDTGCDGLEGDPLAWCEGNPTYWQDRQAETTYVGNDRVRAGVNTSYGGTVFQLYDDDWTHNLLMEHGGAAIQLSIWGYDEVGGTGWFGYSWCDATPYGSEADCLAAGHGSCVARAWAEGAHVADCADVEPCVGWTAGAPFNPIQAQGSDCAWANAANDCDSATWRGDALVTSHGSPRHFTKSGPGVTGLSFDQVVEPGDFWLRLDHSLRYSGSQTWSDHDQEIPAFFTAHGVDQRFYWYEGDAPFADPDSAVSSAEAPLTGVLGIPGRDPVSSLPVLGQIAERWWTACDASDDRCVTLATFEDDVNHASLQAVAGEGAYLTPMGRFHLSPGFDETWTTWVFPYRYDEEVDGRTVREVIFELAAAEGCTAEVDCNGIDEDCDGEDRCAETGDGGASDGGASDGGASDGGASDGGASDGGASDGGASDGGASDGGASDGGGTAEDGGTSDGGAVDEDGGHEDQAIGSRSSPGAGCGCAATSPGLGMGILALPGLLLARRRSSRFRRDRGSRCHRGL